MPKRKEFVGWDNGRVRLTEEAATLDELLTLILALHYGRGPSHVLSLLGDVFWRLPIEVRINLLSDGLWRTGLHDEVPFLEPTLRAIFRIRHVVAHSVTYEQSDISLTLVTIKRGARQEVTLKADELMWALDASDRCRSYFRRIEGRIGETAIWGQLYGFDER
jgi:hypothetical protein